MDLQAITQMLTSRNIKVLHLEPTDVCQAECPLCARETDHNFDKSRRHQLSVEMLEHLLPEGFVSNLDKMFMCGNYGDPAAGNQTIAIYEWFRSQNPNITLGMNTNGGIGTTFWWHSLGKIFNQPSDYVVFSIDGLEDTNSDYRVNVNWSKVMQNAEAFIAAGIVHHVAFRTPTDEFIALQRAKVLDADLHVSPIMDRTYFHSIYLLKQVL